MAGAQPASASELGAFRICRREVFDVLSAAGGGLPYDKLRDRVEPRLRKYVLKEIENAGGIDAYLPARLNHFRGADGKQAPMIEWTDTSDLVHLVKGFKLKEINPSGNIVIYVPGSNEALERMEQISTRIRMEREGLGLVRGAWDFLVPSTSSAEVRRSFKKIGFLVGQSYVTDQSGYVIDGRVCKAVHDDNNVKVKIRGPIEGAPLFPIAHGIVYSYHTNAHRLSKEEQTEYRERIFKELGVQFSEIERMYTLTLQWVLTPPPPWFTVRSFGVQLRGRDDVVRMDFSTDQQWVKVRDMLKASGAPEYEASKVKRAFEKLGLPVEQPKAHGNKATGKLNAIWVRVADLPEFVTESTPQWSKASDRGRWDRFCDILLQVAKAVEEDSLREA